MSCMSLHMCSDLHLLAASSLPRSWNIALLGLLWELRPIFERYKIDVHLLATDMRQRGALH